MISLLQPVPTISRSFVPGVRGGTLIRLSAHITRHNEPRTTESRRTSKTYHAHDLNSYLMTGNLYPEVTTLSSNNLAKNFVDVDLYKCENRHRPEVCSPNTTVSIDTRTFFDPLTSVIHLNHTRRNYVPCSAEKELLDYTTCKEFQDDEDPANSPQQCFRQTVQVLREELPKILAPDTLDGSLYAEDIQFSDKVSGLRVHGKSKYELVLGAFAAGAKVCFTAPEFHLIWCNACESTRTISCRWQIRGSLRVPLVPPSLNYYDRHSVFDVDRNGKIWRHTIDRMTPTRPDGIDGAGAAHSLSALLGFGGGEFALGVVAARRHKSL
eukprot:m.212618 g.212618  ORF g.212618 m.212618 type:complete len:324 (-) comp19048_c0_seq1:445-1416(-)